jgi:hypothetical protein
MLANYNRINNKLKNKIERTFIMINELLLKNLKKKEKNNVLK